MRKAISRVIERFAADHPQYSTPVGAKEKCREASGRFCDYLQAAGIDAVVDEFDVIDGVAHKATRIGSLWVDWTARQYDPNAPWPKLTDDSKQTIA